MLRKVFAVLFLLLTSQLLPAAEYDYPPEVKPIIEHRCMACHGCYDAPCQLKMDAWIGLQRGASKAKVYDGTRLLTANMTRLFEDAQTTEEWRKKGFYPVLEDWSAEEGVLYRMLELKQQHPLPEADKKLPDSFDFSLHRDQQCPKPEQFDRFARNKPLWGMPYGLPALKSQEYDVLTRWLRDGAKAIEVAPRPAEEQDAVARWEEFFNGNSLKQQLMARYIYEHLFIGNIHFDALQQPSVFYKMVRSKTPAGQPIELIVSRRPYDDPGREPFYYRLQSRPVAILDKRHMPYVLNPARKQRWQNLFLDADYTVSALPDYEESTTSNPFLVFEQLPVQARYKFMLDEAEFTIMGFIKGPVCRGQVALNVIDDHFWIAFTRPDFEDRELYAHFLAEQSKNLTLPDARGGLLVSLVEWKIYATRQQKMLKKKIEYMSQLVDQGKLDVNLGLIWDGDGDNENAALTIFRHNDSASVVKGFVGQQPKTAWVVDYSLLERIHYLLVAGFDVYGSVGHQLKSRLYMDFLRMEGEQNFLMFLPKDDRIALRDYWYRGASNHVKSFVLSPENAMYERNTDITYKTDDSKREFLMMLEARLAGARSQHYNITNAHFARLQKKPSEAFSYMPEVAFVQLLTKQGEERYYSILHNSAHSNNAQIFKEAERRLPREDSLTVVSGYIGSYPNMFFQLVEKDVDNFVRDIERMQGNEDYTRLVKRYGVRRSSPWFWKLSDSINASYQKMQPTKAGLFDLNRYQNR